MGYTSVMNGIRGDTTFTRVTVIDTTYREIVVTPVSLAINADSIGRGDLTPLGLARLDSLLALRLLTPPATSVPLQPAPGVVNTAPLEHPEINRYNETYSDSLISISVTADVLGDLLDWNVGYILNLPTIHERTTETERIRYRDNRIIPFLGVESSIPVPERERVVISPLVGVRIGRFSSYYRYDTSGDSPHRLGIIYGLR